MEFELKILMLYVIHYNFCVTVPKNDLYSIISYIKKKEKNSLIRQR